MKCEGQGRKEDLEQAMLACVRGGVSQEEPRKAATSPEDRMPVGVLKAVT